MVRWFYVEASCMAADSLHAAVPPIPIFGNGDAYDHRTYWDNVNATGVDGIMIARGALIKPWIFTEIKERRDWDISARERLDMIGNLASFGLEHWGSDTLGVNATRRFVCEAMSFTYRYIPVGLLERFPSSLNDRPYPFRGRDELEVSSGLSLFLCLQLLRLLHLYCRPCSRAIMRRTGLRSAPCSWDRQVRFLSNWYRVGR